MAVSHEALLQNWSLWQEWRDESREALRQKRKLAAAAEWADWQRQAKPVEASKAAKRAAQRARGKAAGLLLSGRALQDAQAMAKTARGELALSRQVLKFIRASQRQQRRGRLQVAAVALLLPALRTLGLAYLIVVGYTQSILAAEECQPNLGVKWLVQYLWLVGYGGEFREKNLCKENLTHRVLKRANFQGAQLERADFWEAQLEGADFWRAQLEWTVFLGA